MNLSVQHLKVDQTVLGLDNQSVFISNINIPERYLDQVRPVLDRVYAFARREYDDIPDVRYQLSATYDLKNKDTEEIRHWAGSFLPQANNPSSLDDFHIFGPSFAERLEPLCDRLAIGAKLSLRNADTRWEFDSLTSLVVNFQAKVPDEFPTLIRRNLRLTRHGRQRNHTTFLLP